MPRSGEHKTVQARILAYAQEIGWSFVPRAVNAAILKRLAEIDGTLLQHDAALRDIYRKPLPLLQPPPDPPKRRIEFISGEE